MGSLELTKNGLEQTRQRSLAQNAEFAHTNLVDSYTLSFARQFDTPLNHRHNGERAIAIREWHWESCQITSKETNGGLFYSAGGNRMYTRG